MRIFGPKREEATGKWKNLCYEQRPDLNSSSDVKTMIKSEGGGRQMVYSCSTDRRDEKSIQHYSRKLNGRHHLTALDVVERIRFKSFLTV
jgi:hypothetical protein